MTGPPSQPKRTPEEIHYLHISQKGKRRYEWHCTCGVKGHGETEEACEFSHMRHLIGLTFRRRGL